MKSTARPLPPRPLAVGARRLLCRWAQWSQWTEPPARRGATLLCRINQLCFFFFSRGTPRSAQQPRGDPPVAAPRQHAGAARGQAGQRRHR